MSKAFNFDDILNKGMDEIADAPEFTQLPDGVHLLQIEKIENKTQGKGDDAAPVVVFRYKYLSAIELADQSKTPPAEGSVCTEQFRVNEEGLPYLKRHVRHIWAENTAMNLSQLLEALVGKNVAITSKARKFADKNDKTKMLDGWNSQQMILA